ncbi:MAG: hypothetical protein IKH82_06070 [Clostridiales bacterium]|nr:hypothetical protein [Clostridiales bacterium]
MKKSGNRAVGLLLTTVMLLGFLLPSGCLNFRSGDPEQIEMLVNYFIEDFAEGDEDGVEFLVEEGFECDFKTGPKEEVMLKMASRTEIREIVNIDVDNKAHEAKAKVKISYVNAEDIIFNYDNYGKTKEQYFELIDKAVLQTKTLKFNFFYIPSEGKWIIAKESAEKYKALFDFASQVNMIMMSEYDASLLFDRAIDRFAEGDFDSPECPLDIYTIRYFDSCLTDDEVVNEGAREYAKAYFKYIADHGYTIHIDSDNHYRAVLYGYAPSKNEILDYVSSDECVEADYIVRMRLVSANRRDVQPDTLRSAIDADLYKNLAKKIPDMSPDNFQVDLRIVIDYDLNSGKTYERLEVSDENTGLIIPIDWYEAEEALERTPEQEFRCREKACEDLLASGEISQEKYDIYMLAIERDRYINSGGTVPEYEFIRNVEWEGTGEYVNQAVDVVEVLPDFSDGQLLYGESDYDSNGYYIFYSSEPGWLNTAGYYIDNDKVVVMLKYDNKFAKGTTLVYDWYVDDEEVGDSVFFTVEEDDTDEFVFEIPNMQIGRYSKYEFRLWEEDHMHVIAYVSLSQT